MKKPNFMSSRKFRQGSIATAITVVVVALVVVVNFLATSLTKNYSLTLDLTPNQVFSITEDTKKFLSELDTDVVIYVLNTEEAFSGSGEYSLQAMEVLKKYARESSRISLEFIDVVANPTFAQRYPDLQLSTSSILITNGDRVRDVTTYNLYEIESDQYGNGYPIASKAEQVLTSAVLAVTSKDIVNVAVISGHNEEDISVFTSLLQSNNYMVEHVSIVTSEIDSTFSSAIICAPQRDYTEDELRRLDSFLVSGGAYGKTLYYYAPAEQPDMPNLAAFLADWGIAVNAGMVFESDPNRYIPQQPFIAVADFAEQVYSAKVIAKGLFPYVAYARPLELLFQSKDGVTTSSLLQFSASAGIAVDENTIQQNVGPVPFAVMGQYTSYDGVTPLQSQVVVLGSSAFIFTDFISNPNLANSEYLLDLMSTLSGREEQPVQIQSKTIGSQALGINALQAIIVGVVLAVIFPLALLIFGLVVWGRRRHR